jgi:hypothetical protein
MVQEKKNVCTFFSLRSIYSYWTNGSLITLLWEKILFNIILFWIFNLFSSNSYWTNNTLVTLRSLPKDKHRLNLEILKKLLGRLFHRDHLKSLLEIDTNCFHGFNLIIMIQTFFSDRTNDTLITFITGYSNWTLFSLFRNMY